MEAHVGESWLLACLVTPGMLTWMQCGSPKFHEIACRRSAAGKGSRDDIMGFGANADVCAI